MRKKIYIPDRILVVIGYIILFTILPIGIYMFIKLSITTFKSIHDVPIGDTIKGIVEAICCLLFALLVVGYQILLYMSYTIILDKEKIFIREDINSKRSKIQYYTFAYYKDIKSVDIFWSNRKSNGEKTGEDSITGGSVAIPYLRIITNNDEQKLFFIFITSKKSIKKLIDELKRRMENCGNTAQIEDTDIIVKRLGHNNF